MRAVNEWRAIIHGDILCPFRTLTVSTGYQTLRVWLISCVAPRLGRAKQIQESGLAAAEEEGGREGQAGRGQGERGGLGPKSCLVNQEKAGHIADIR